MKSRYATTGEGGSLSSVVIAFPSWLGVSREHWTPLPLSSKTPARFDLFSQVWKDEKGEAFDPERNYEAMNPNSQADAIWRCANTISSLCEDCLSSPRMSSHGLMVFVDQTVTLSKAAEAAMTSLITRVGPERAKGVLSNYIVNVPDDPAAALQAAQRVGLDVIHAYMTEVFPVFQGVTHHLVLSEDNPPVFAGHEPFMIEASQMPLFLEKVGGLKSAISAFLS